MVKMISRVVDAVVALIVYYSAGKSECYFRRKRLGLSSFSLFKGT